MTIRDAMEAFIEDIKAGGEEQPAYGDAMCRNMLDAIDSVTAMGKVRYPTAMAAVMAVFVHLCDEAHHDPRAVFQVLYNAEVQARIGR